jgi:hypothetical protein
VSALNDWAARWLRDEENEAVEEDFRDVRAGEKAKRVAEAVADNAPPLEGKMSAEQAEKFARSFWTTGNVLAVKFFGPEYDNEAERDDLVEASVPMCQEYLPANLDLEGGLSGFLPIELVFLVTVGIVYVPKHMAAKRRKEAEAAAAAAPPSEEKEVSGEVTARGIRAVG